MRLTACDTRPEHVIDDAHVRHVLDDPVLGRIQQRLPFAGIWILDDMLSDPDEKAMVQVMVEQLRSPLAVPRYCRKRPRPASLPSRALIDQQLRDRGWDAHCVDLRYGKDTRPVKGRHMAIAEWPTQSGLADYALFVGETYVGIVEAKRYRKNILAAVDQAER